MPAPASSHPIQGRRIRNKALALVVILLTAAGSLTVGVGSMSLGDLWSTDGNNAALLLMASRIPRTLALILAGAGLAVSGAIMQMLARNRFAEPAAVGTADSAALGMIVALAIAPKMPVLGKMALAGGFALMGTAIFLAILRQIPLRSALMVPLIGIMFGGVVNAMGTFLAYRFDLLQSIGAWSGGDFSMVLRGRYELLWVALALTLVAYAAAARFTLAGLGEAVARNLGSFIGRFHRAVLELLALDDVGIDKRTREAWSNAGLVECRLAGAIWSGKQDKAGSHAAASSFA